MSESQTKEDSHAGIGPSESPTELSCKIAQFVRSSSCLTIAFESKTRRGRPP